MNYKGKVLIAAPVHDVLTSGLQSDGYELLRQEDINQDLAMRLVKDCVGVVTSTRLQVDKKMIDAAPNLQFIARMGSGMEVIDVPYAEGRGIICIGSPEGNCNAVAEHALGMLLSLNKKIDKSFNELKEGLWLREENRGTELEGKTIGIIGYGHTGTAFAKLLRGFNLRILVYDKYKKIVSESHIEVCATIDEIVQESDIVSVHVPFREDTFHLIDKAFIEQMKKPFVLLNTSRGTVVDGAVLCQFLENRKILGLALDVWEEEPLSKMSVQMRNTFNELITLPNVLLTPHIAGYSHEALYKMSRTLLERIIK
jgi:D-3-phosphoglycerate dehydrogenase / 2-oxoglutarate reductase